MLRSAITLRVRRKRSSGKREDEEAGEGRTAPSGFRATPNGLLANRLETDETVHDAQCESNTRAIWLYDTFNVI